MIGIADKPTKLEEKTECHLNMESGSAKSEPSTFRVIAKKKIEVTQTTVNFRINSFQFNT